MPNAQPLLRPLTLGATLVIALIFAVFAADSADAAKPAPTLTLAGGCQADFGAGVILTADGKGRWARVEVEVSFDGTLFDDVFLGRAELGVPSSWYLGEDWAVFRARSVRKNGTPTGDWTTTDPVICA